MKKALIVAFVLPSAWQLVAQSNPKKTAIDADDAYKNNCMRCHAAVQSYSPSQTATIVRHMRVRANLTEEESQAILRYLQDASAGSARNRHAERRQKSEQ